MDSGPTWQGLDVCCVAMLGFARVWEEEEDVMGWGRNGAGVETCTIFFMAQLAEAGSLVELVALLPCIGERWTLVSMA